ncbi:MAG: SDR family NAD(P)-dependent oxidoreductase [Aequorivita antarctica]
MKTALITGTSKGIGLETALIFGRAGYKVYATMRNPEAAFDFKQKIKNESLDITIYKMDVDCDATTDEDWYEAVQNTFGLDAR